MIKAGYAFFGMWSKRDLFLLECVFFEHDQNGMCLLLNVLIYNVIKTGCALFVIYIFLNVLFFECDQNGKYSIQKVP